MDTQCLTALRLTHLRQPAAYSLSLSYTRPTSQMHESSGCAVSSQPTWIIQSGVKPMRSSCSSAFSSASSPSASGTCMWHQISDICIRPWRMLLSKGPPARWPCASC